MRPRIYCAGQEASCGSEQRAQMVERLRGMFPGVEVYDPASRHASAAATRRAWPRVLPTLTALVILRGGDDTIGCEVIGELADSVRAGLPIAVMDSGGRLFDVRGLVLLGMDARTPRRAAWVLSGHRSGLVEQMRQRRARMAGVAA